LDDGCCFYYSVVAYIVKGSPSTRRTSLPLKLESTVSTPTVAISSEVTFINSTNEKDAVVEYSNSDVEANDEVARVNENNVSILFL